MLYTFSPFFYNAVNEHFFQVMGTCFCGNFHVNSLLCHSQTLHDSCCSSLCLVHGQLNDPSNLVYKLIIIALIWNNWSPFQFSKCRNIHVKTITIDWCNHNGSRTLDFGLLQKDRSRVQSRLITRSTCQFAHPKVPTTTGFYAIAYPRVINHILTCKWQYM